MISEEKIIFNITFHWHFSQLKWHLENLFSWDCSSKCEYVLVTSHKENLDSIVEWVKENYPQFLDQVDPFWINEDEKPFRKPFGNHLGCTVNVIEGLKYIKNNKINYEYVANVEADNQFRDEQKFLKLIDKLKENNHHMLLVDHPSTWQYRDNLSPTPSKYGSLFKSFPDKQDRYHYHMTTLNIYSKFYIENYLPLDEYYEEFMDYGWCGAPGTPFEAYFALAFNKKNNFKTDEELISHVEQYSYPLYYDRYLNPCNYAEPDDLTPDRYMKYGIVNCPNARGSIGASQPDIWLAVLKFIELHDPLKYDF